MAVNEDSVEDSDGGGNSEAEVGFFSNPANMLSYSLSFPFPANGV